MTYGDGHCARCQSRIPINYLMCRYCWRRVPSELRRMVMSAWRRYMSDEVSLGRLRQLQDEAVESAR